MILLLIIYAILSVMAGTMNPLAWDGQCQILGLIALFIVICLSGINKWTDDLYKDDDD